MEDNQLITDYQFGFHKNRRTLDALFITHTVSVLSHVRRKPMLVAFIDFAKAFDTVLHEYLWEKLNKIESFHYHTLYV